MSGFTHDRNNKNVEYYTPPSVFNLLGLRFGIDPCHPVGPPLPWVPAERHYTREDNGLVKPWGEGLAWVNPPYDDVAAWMALLHKHGQGVALLYSRAPGWFHDHVAGGTLLLYLRKRIIFVDRNCQPKLDKHGKPGSPGCESMLIAWGGEAADALARAKHRDPNVGTLMAQVNWV